MSPGHAQATARARLGRLQHFLETLCLRFLERQVASVRRPLHDLLARRRRMSRQRAPRALGLPTSRATNLRGSKASTPGSAMPRRWHCVCAGRRTTHMCVCGVDSGKAAAVRGTACPQRRSGRHERSFQELVEMVQDCCAEQTSGAMVSSRQVTCGRQQHYRLTMCNRRTVLRVLCHIANNTRMDDRSTAAIHTSDAQLVGQQLRRDTHKR